MPRHGPEARDLAAGGGLLRRPVSPDTDLLALARQAPQRYPFLLESVSVAEGHAGHDVLFAFPATRLELRHDGQVYLDDVPSGEDFFVALDTCWQAEQDATREADLIFQGGWFLYFAYELAGHIEPCLQLPAGNDGLPVATAVRFHTALQRNRATGETLIISEAGHGYEQDAICADIDALAGDTCNTAAETEGANGLSKVIEADPADYLDAVARIKALITAGDVFQVNLSRPWRASSAPLSETDITALYARLRETNPAPFAALACWPGAAILSSSPERLVRVSDGLVETRPIAGTRPRQGGSERDRISRHELLSHPKERAEHIMLIDLERNDLGRICTPGSIQVDELMVTESYAHVHHIVSNVQGRLRPSVTPGEIIRAVFPGGTITGCPKVRCMEIIAQLEQAARGPYTGSLGYLNRNGDMDLNILIRTIVWRGDQLEIRAGAGIVADSDAQRELDETRAKAEGMLRALRPA